MLVILFCLVMMLFTVSIHVFGIYFISNIEKHLLNNAKPGIASESILFSVLSCLLMVVHLFAIFVWAIGYFFILDIPVFGNAFFYSLSSYSTVGIYSTGPAGEMGRLTGAFESCVGMLMFGLSVSYLFAVRDNIRRKLS
ncbi:ion channel [Crenobacter caeni]|uniref:Potassium channel domain-containing protein n=1 Tax=Crenobacter caeni TaxID=2705474 RepID=A0A6B2KNP3_9NEIS|nr:ion channel [Crenobacter caeni]NDV11805.1 hypothetical protein [Crenobacter caeni]